MAGLESSFLCAGQLITNLNIRFTAISSLNKFIFTLSIMTLGIRYHVSKGIGLSLTDAIFLKLVHPESKVNHRIHSFVMG